MWQCKRLTDNSQNLNNRQTFQASHLQRLHSLLSEPTALNSFSPLPSFHRLIISYPTTEAAIATRQLLESHPLTTTNSLFSPSDATSAHTDINSTDPVESRRNGPKPGLPTTETTSRGNTEQVKIYFGAPTPLIGSADLQDIHLKAPSLGKLLFISPPPSPPCGWEIREEEPPNRVTHAEDLQRALAGLSAGPASGLVQETEQESAASGDREVRHQETGNGEMDMDITPDGPTLERKRNASGQASRSSSKSSASLDPATNVAGGRGRRNTITVYHPLHHGGAEELPSVMVEDTTGVNEGEGADSDAPEDDMDGHEERGREGGRGQGRMMTHTARPPVELMEQ